MGKKVSYFHGENPAEFRIWCAIIYQKGFTPVYMTHANMLVLGQAKAPQSIKHIDACRIHGETNFTQVTWIETIRPQ